MSSPLTKEELEHLLQRAASRSVFREPRIFSLPELVAAGEELGIDALSIQEVYAEYQQEQQRPPPVRQRPVGARIALQRGADSLSIFVPAPRPNIWRRLGYVGGGGLALLGLASFGAGLVPWPLLLLAGTLTLGGVYCLWHWDRAPAHELRLHRDGSGVLLQSSGFGTDSFPLLPGQVHARLATVTESDPEGTQMRTVVALDHGTQTHRLMDWYSYAEQAWVVAEIEHWLGR